MHRLTLRQAVTRSMLLSVLIPLLVLAGAGWFGIERLQTDALERENSAHARTVRAEVDGHLGTFEVLAVPYHDSTTADLLSANMFERLWQRRVDEIGPLEAMTLVDTQGAVALAVVDSAVSVPAELLLKLDYSRWPEYVTSMAQREPRWSDVHVSPLSGDPSVSYVYPLKSGAIVLEVSLKSLTDVITTGVEDITPMVVDRDGVVVHHPDADVVALKPSLADHEFIRKALRGRPSTDRTFTMEGAAYLASAEPMPGTGWAAISLEPLSDVRNAVLQTQGVAVAVIAFGAMLAMMLAWRLSHRLSAPLTELTAHVEKMGAGNFAPPPHSLRYHEPAVLGEALEGMSEALRVREDRIRASAQQYQFLVESLRGIPYEYDYGNDRFTYVGPQAVTLLGHPLEAWTDFESWKRMIHPDDREEAARACITASEAGRYHEITYRMITADGRTVWVHDVVSVVEEPYDTMRAIGVLLDVTEEQAATELRLAAERADASSRAKSGFLAYMSHELRTPLNSIIGFSQLMLDGATGDLTEEQRRQVGIIRRSGAHLMALVNDILDLEKIESGGVDVHVNEFDMSEVVRGAVDEISPLAAAKALTTTLGLPGEPVRVRCDEDKVRQILLNLLSNAVKYTEHGSVHVDVERDSGQSVSVRVTDTGIGIDPDLLEEVFDEFRSAGRGGETVQRSTGLGLAIARKLARLLGGDIVVSSTFGQGSVFTLRLPVSCDTKGSRPGS